MDQGTDHVSHTRTGRRARVVIGLGLAACVYAAFPNARPDLTPFNCDDGEAYIGLADSIATGRGYTRCLNPDQYIPHKTWPPGLPLLLTPVIAAFGPSLLAIKLMMCGVGVLGLVFMYLLVRDLTDARLAGWVTAATACSAHYFWFSHQSMAEVPTFAASVTILWLIARAGRRPEQWRWWCLAGIVTGYGALIKGLVLLLLPAPLAGAFRMGPPDRRVMLRRYAVFVVIAIAPTAAWAVRNNRVQAESRDGINQFRMLFQETANDPNSPLVTPGRLVRQVYENVAWGLIYRVPDQVIPLARLLRLRDLSAGRFIALFLTALVVVALIASVWRRIWPVHVYVAAMLALLTTLSTGGTARYFVPLAPLIVFLVATAVRSSRLWSRFGRMGAVLAWVWLGAAGLDLAAAIHQQETSPYADDRWADFVDVARNAPEFIPPHATVCVHNPNTFTLVSGRRTWITQPHEPFDLLGAMRRGTFTHLVVSSGGRPRDTDRQQWARDHADELKRVGSDHGYDVFVLRK